MSGRREYKSKKDPEWGLFLERAKGIEPSSYPWEGYILPVYYARYKGFPCVGFPF